MSSNGNAPATQSSSAHITQARELLAWSPAELARKSGVSAATVRKCEAGARTRASSIAAMRAALQAAGVIFTADGPYLANAPMTYETYARFGHARYAKLAKLVADTIAAAIEARGGMRVLTTPSREKKVASLKKKLAKRGVAEDADLAIALKDLAGAQVVFLSDTDLNRFMQSGLLLETFEVDLDRTRIHYADKRAPESDHQFTANNYVVRLKPDLAVLPENADIAGLWCELQLHTALHYAWSKMAHDITYKRPDLDGVGEELMKKIDDRMTMIMQDLIIPAGFHFQKVERDFEELVGGRDLLDTNVLDEIVAAPNNNVRSELIESFEGKLLPLLAPKIMDWAALIRKAMLDAAKIARVTPETPHTIKLENGEDMFVASGEEPEAVIEKIVSILTDPRLIYADLAATFDALATLYIDAATDKERDIVGKTHEKLAAYNLHLWPKAGAAVQVMLLDRMDKLTDNERVALAPFLTDIYGQFLEPDMDGFSSTSSQGTFSKAPVPPAPSILRVRSAAIDALFAQLREATDIRRRRNIVHAIENATRVPSYGDHDPFLLEILKDSTRVCELYRGDLDRLGDELKVKVENDMLHLYRRYRDYEFEGELAPQLDAARAALLEELLHFRDAVNADAEFVLCKSLVGHDTVLPHEWDEPEDHYDFEGRRAFHTAAADDLVGKLSARNATRWPGIAKRCADMHGDETTGIVRFMCRAGETKPKLAQSWLAPMSASNASPFVHHLLEGLSQSAPNVVQDYINSSIARGENLRPILNYLCYHDPIDFDVLERAVAAAFAGDDNHAVYLAFDISLERAEALGADHARDLFRRGLAEYAKRGMHWSQAASFWKMRGLFAMLLDEDLRMVLKAFEDVHRLEHNSERMLADIAERLPGEVVALFGRRQKIEDGLRQEDRRNNRSYDAIPFKFRQLAKALAPHIEEVLGQAWNWTEADPRLAEFKGAAFVANVYETWSPEIEKALWALFQSGEAPKRDFVFAVLKRYNNHPAIHGLLRDILAEIGDDAERQQDVENVLQQTGMMWGEFGFANAYRGKNKMLEAWADDKRPAVQAFITKMKRDFENSAAHQQRRGEQDLAAFRLEYDEEPTRPEDRNKFDEQAPEDDAA